MNGTIVVIFCAVLAIAAYHLAEYKQKQYEEEERRKAQEAIEAELRLEAQRREEERRAYERRNAETARIAKAEAEAALETSRARASMVKINDLTRVLEAKTNLAIALENAAEKEADPSKKAIMQERAAKTYTQAHIISEKIDKLMEDKL